MVIASLSLYRVTLKNYFQNQIWAWWNIFFLIFGTRSAFTEIRQVFIKALILIYFDSNCHICIKTNILGYSIKESLIS